MSYGPVSVSTLLRVYSNRNVNVAVNPPTTDGVAASAVLTSEAGGGSGQPANAETVIIGIKTYTLQSSLTNVDGHVKIGATVEATLTNLKNAINGSGGTIGTDYAAATLPNTQVTATSNTTSVTVTAIAVGTTGNAIGVSGTYPDSDDASWDDTTLSGGVDNTGATWDSFPVSEALEGVLLSLAVDDTVSVIKGEGESDGKVWFSVVKRL